MTTATQTQVNVLNVLTAPLRGLWESAFSRTSIDGRIGEIEALRRLSDAELHARGLQRDDIVRYVYCRNSIA